ncbi:type VI secretion system Vgr family protein, partial [Parachitinimonas caeni]
VDIQALPSNLPFRPERSTPKPIVQGPQTAVIVGPAGEEIWTDEHARVKVQFHWDRRGKKNDQSSCWVRVSQPWAGQNFGMVAIPRIGQEVVVSFLEGDPDQPLITGRVYNADQMPPWDLPGNKTQSGILSRSSQGGHYDHANALRFEDKKGAEEVWLHAEKDQRIEVEHDESHWVGNDRRKTIDRDETTIVHRHRTETVDGNETITVHQNRTETVDQNETLTIHQHRKERVDHNETISIGDNRNEDVGKNESVTIGKNQSLSVGSSRDKQIGRNEQDKISKNWSIKVGQLKTETVGMAYMQNVGLAKMMTIGMAYNVNV